MMYEDEVVDNTNIAIIICGDMWAALLEFEDGHYYFFIYGDVEWFLRTFVRRGLIFLFGGLNFFFGGRFLIFGWRFLIFGALTAKKTTSMPWCRHFCPVACQISDSVECR